MSGHPIWTVRLICTGKGTHASRVLAEMFLRPDDADLLTALAASHGEERGREIYDQSRISHTVPAHLRGSDRRGRIRREWMESDDIPEGVADPADSSWMLHPCPTCRLQVPAISGPRMRAIVQECYGHGLNRLDMSLASSML